MGNTKSVKLNGRGYEVCGKLGSGGFSEVYLVEGHRHGRKQRYALKVMACVEDDQLQRALLEIQLHRRLAHPNVLPLLESEIRMKRHGQRSDVENALGRTKEVLLLFPVLARGSIQDVLNDAATQKAPAFTQDECVRLFEGIVRGVLEIHQLGLAHRDLKPANILLDDANTPVVMDLGSVAPLTTRVTSQHDALAMVETAAQFSSGAFRAPELYDDCFRGDLTAATDVWSLGCVLYAMAYGPFGPFESATEGIKVLAIRNGSLRFPPSPTYSPGFNLLLQDMLQVSPDARPTLDHILTRLGKLNASSPPTSSSTQASTLSTSSSRQVTSSAADWADFAHFSAPVRPTPPLLHFASADAAAKSPRKASRRSISDRDQLARHGRAMLQHALAP
ncbi:NAK/MPSK protein kinase [Saprolegnia diclina VS20]|uniref:non-specific serine/threonine protein kinase n=1 Tax=Saprolegnia diclina (strain VS20) TaxID=1156394 RepID=T0QVB2_SAPDV|nr:NAK/MPSK protein kinase [Saprolegnia diclina VS20]EQC37945.1 NAK/MPSK protein kinase [Saprolegnia diclina VS20]|eukprot:XP_008608878.1 NAK/MPSK protein kinase [Saprolegnia diclina VS20]